MKTKFCPRCKKELSIDAFSQTPNRIKPYCGDCQREHQREYRRKNKDKYRAQKNRRRQRVRLKIKEFTNNVKNVPCVDCGGKYPPYVMDFHHRNPKTKEFKINEMKSCTSLIGFDSLVEKLKKEIKKCIIICSNCHRIRHNEDK